MQRIRLWMKAFLGVHIAAGASSFLLAPVALATAKGGKQHKRWGMVYLWSMGVVAATALPMALYRPVLFLALVAVFSFYLAFSGFRVLRLKELARGGSATPVDWIAAVVTFVASACLAGFGAFRPAWVQGFGIVSIVFGFIGMRASVAADVEVCAKADGEDVLVVHAPGEHDWKLYRGVDRVLRGDVVAVLRERVVRVAVADDCWCSGDCADDGLLQDGSLRRG